MQDHTERSKFGRKWLAWVIGFLVFLVFSRLFEMFGEPEKIEKALELQTQAIKVVSRMAIYELPTKFFNVTHKLCDPEPAFERCRLNCIRQTQRDDCDAPGMTLDAVCSQIKLQKEACVNKCASAYSSVCADYGITAPAYGLIETIKGLWNEGNHFVMLQLALGALAVVVLSKIRVSDVLLLSHDRLGPAYYPALAFLAIVLATVIAAALQIVMLGALEIAGRFTKLAGAAAGATGVLGFIAYCSMKLIEHGLTHRVTDTLTKRAPSQQTKEDAS